MYALGHEALTPKGWLMAAVLAGGKGAVTAREGQHVTAPGRSRKGQQGLKLHLDPRDVTTPDAVHRLLNRSPGRKGRKPIVELDSREHHLNGRAFEDDRPGGAILAAKHRVIRITHRQIKTDLHGVRTRLARALGA